MTHGLRKTATGGALGVVLGALVAGCGSATHYSLAKTSECLRKAHAPLRLRSKVDFLASTAPDGAINVRFAHNQVTISFLHDPKQADALAQAYRRVRGRNIGIEDVLRPQANAVLLWALHPDPGEEGTVKGCLK